MKEVHIILHFYVAMNNWFACVLSKCSSVCKTNCTISLNCTACSESVFCWSNYFVPSVTKECIFIKTICNIYKDYFIDQNHLHPITTWLSSKSHLHELVHNVEYMVATILFIKIIESIFCKILVCLPSSSAHLFSTIILLIKMIYTICSRRLFSLSRSSVLFVPDDLFITTICTPHKIFIK